MDVHRITTGLWRWTAYHEEWRQDVGCVYLDTDDATIGVQSFLEHGPGRADFEGR